MEAAMTGSFFVIGYGIFCLLIGLFTREAKSLSELAVADRNIGVLPMAASIAATWCAAPALFISAQHGYQSGIVGVLWFIVPNVICLLIFIPVSKAISRISNGLFSIPEIMGNRHGKYTKGAYTFSMFLVSFTIGAAQIVAGAKLITALTGFPYFWATVIIAIVVGVYCLYSGIRADVVTDCLQMFLLVIGSAFFVSWIIGIRWEGISTGIFGINNITPFSLSGWRFAWSMGIPTTLGLLAGAIGDQMFWQRAFAIKRGNIGKVFILGAIGFAVIPCCMALVGIIAAGSKFVPSDVSMVNLEFTSSVLPSWTIPIFTIMMMSGLFSTVDSNIVSCGVLTRSFIKSEKTLAPRMVMILVLGLIIIVANFSGTSVFNLFLAYGLMRSATVIPTLFSVKMEGLNDLHMALGVILATVVGMVVYLFGDKTIAFLLSYGISGLFPVVGKMVFRGVSK
jgi:Na+/proline symporter